ncbi:MAG: hypothetical protein KME57_10005 [Scytonema hyalinum WJT4-NPBG1]|jgi:hypothetical protein|nr:hypothetical protein [Scytonema hyalinum WJT4-NPBG1]
MLNKSIAFGLLAAGLMIVPTAAFAGQSQINTQETKQEAAAFDGGKVNQSANSTSVQTQTRRERGSRYYGGYRRGCKAGSQAQDSVQSTRQAGAAEYGSRVNQNSNTRNRQSQAASC